jgi:23S rRNA pseudouridine1911/1915/1917 synthase
VQTEPAQAEGALKQSVELEVQAADSGQRLDRYLARVLAQTAVGATSRAELQRWVEASAVLVDGVQSSVSAKVRPGQRVRVSPPQPQVSTADADASIAFEIVHLDADLILIDKPAGLVVHPARGNEHGTLVNGLLGRGLFKLDDFRTPDPPVQLSEQDPEHADPQAHLRPGIVHRLDKDTSGVMVVARTAFARAALMRVFAEHTIHREYWAFAEGYVEDATISTLYGRHPYDRVKFSGRVHEGKRAITHLRVVTRFEGATLVACRLETGRTHQIRVHLAEAGHPLLADALYGRTPRDRRIADLAAKLGRQALHARSLGFTHPRSGIVMRFERELPGDLQALHAGLVGLTPQTRTQPMRKSRLS